MVGRAWIWVCAGLLLGCGGEEGSAGVEGEADMGGAMDGGSPLADGGAAPDGGPPDAGSPDLGPAPFEPGLMGAWSDVYGGTHHISADHWWLIEDGEINLRAVVGHGDGYVILLNDDRFFEAGARSRLDLHQAPDGTWWTCMNTRLLGRAEDGSDRPPSDPSDPANGGCGGVGAEQPWLALRPTTLPAALAMGRLSGAVDATLSWADWQIGAAHFTPWFSYGWDSGWLMARNGAENAEHGGRWSRFDWVSEGDGLWLCHSVRDAETPQGVRAAATPDPADPASGGCAGGPWWRLTPR